MPVYNVTVYRTVTHEATITVAADSASEILNERNKEQLSEFLDTWDHWDTSDPEGGTGEQIWVEDAVEDLSPEFAELNVVTEPEPRPGLKNFFKDY